MHRATAVWMLLATACVSISRAVADDWPQLQHDARHSGATKDTPRPPFRIKWEWWKAPFSQRVQPVIADGSVYMPSIDGCIYALDCRTGAVLWKTRCGRKPYVHAFAHSAAFDSGCIYAANTDRHVYALEAKTGRIKWRFRTGGRMRSAPAVAYGTVYVGAPDGFFYAIDAKTGGLAWKAEIGAPIYDTAAVDGGRVFFGAHDMKGYALDAKTGRRLWERQLYGQGVRDRWTVAGAGHVVFTVMPFYNEHEHLAAGTRLIRDHWKEGWKGQRRAIEEFFKEDPFQRAFFVLDAKTGREPYVAPVLYGCGGSQSPHPQPVIDGDGNCYVIYRASEVGGFETWGQTTHYGLYLGRMDLKTGDIERIDWWTQVPPGEFDPKKHASPDGRVKAPLISDESAGIVKAGDALIAAQARYQYMVALGEGIRVGGRGKPRKIAGVINLEGLGHRYEPGGSSGRFSELRAYKLPFGTWGYPSLARLFKGRGESPFGFKEEGKRAERAKRCFENGLQYMKQHNLSYTGPLPVGDFDSDGNDRVRPPAVANGVVYVLAASKVLALEGGAR